MREKINCSNQELHSFMTAFTAPTHGAEIPLFSRIFASITLAFLSVFGAKCTIKTSDGSLRLSKHLIIRALSQSNESIVLLDKQYLIAHHLQNVAHFSIFTKKFSKQPLTSSIKISSISQKAFRSLEQPLPHESSTTPHQNAVIKNYYLDASCHGEGTEILKKINQEIDTLLKEAPVSCGFLQKLPEWTFLLENLVTTKVGDFFSTNGNKLSQKDINTKVSEIGEYTSVLDRMHSHLRTRYNSLSPLDKISSSKRTLKNLKEAIINIDCFAERFKIFQTSLLFKKTQKRTAAPAPVPAPAPAPLLPSAKFPEPVVQPGEIRVLAARGGGIKGLVSTQLLREIEEAVNRDVPIRKRRTIGGLVDIITGTSTGAIIAALASRGYSAKDIDHLYHSFGDRIFEGQQNPLTNFLLEIKRLFWQPKYERGTRLAARKIGRAYLEEQSRNLLNVPFSWTDKELAIPFCIFGSHKKEKTVLVTSQAQKALPIGKQYILGDVVLASTSANTFFPHTNLMPIETMVSDQKYMRLRMYPDSISTRIAKQIRHPSIIEAVDGGFTSNDPSSRVLDEYDLTHQQKKIKVVTIGTGKDPQKVASIFPFSTNVPAIKQIKAVIEGPMAAIEHDIKSRLKLLEKRRHIHKYVVLNPRFTIPVALDSIRTSAKAAMQHAGATFMRANRKEKFTNAISMLRLHERVRAAPTA